VADEFEHTVDRLGFSARVHGKVLKVARTIADLAACDAIDRTQVMEALHFRQLDRQIDRFHLQAGEGRQR